MMELGNFFRIYCCQTHKKWPEFVSHIQNWLNRVSQSVSQSDYRVQTHSLLGGGTKGEIFKEIIKKLPDKPPEEDLPVKILKAYNKAKDKAGKERIRKRVDLNGNPK
jgi:hypothetical protein